MVKTLAEWMTLILAINIVFAPILSHVENLHRKAVDTVLHEAAKEAAIQGEFTDEIINKMKTTLVENYNFSEDKIKFEVSYSSTPPVERQQYIEASLTIPSTFIFVIDIFNPGPRYYTKPITIMSEYIY